MVKTDIIIHDKKDNVGVIVIEKVTKGQDCGCWIMEDDSSSKVKSEAEIPLGHKIALQDLDFKKVLLGSVELERGKL